jgi:hypothetical protein
MIQGVNMIEKFKNIQSDRWLNRNIKFIEVFGNSLGNSTHNHHILPRSLYPEYVSDGWNLTKLTYRAHLIAHYMLAKALGKNMWFAYNNMNAYGEKLNTILYEESMKLVGEQQSIRQKEWLENNEHPRGMLGKKHSKEMLEKREEKRRNRTEEEKEKTRLKLIDTKIKNGSLNHSDETKQKISKSKLGHEVTQETRDKISKTRKERLENGEIIMKEVTQETRDKRSKALTGQIRPTRGKTHIEIYGEEHAETRSKELSVRNKDRVWDDEMRNKSRLSKLGRKWYNKDGESKMIPKDEIEEYEKNGWKKGRK